MKLFIANAFALSMIDRQDQEAGPEGAVVGGQLRRARTPRPVDDPAGFVKDAIDHGVAVESVLGHASTQGLFEAALAIEVPVNRKNIRLGNGDLLLVGQYVGPRLEEGATELPEGATLEWWAI